MDRKSIIILVACFLLLFSWPLFVQKFVFPPKPLPLGMTNAPSHVVTGETGTNLSPAIGTSTVPIQVEAPVLRRPLANTNVAEQLVEVAAPNAHYTFSSYGGGLKLVELLNYPETVYSRRQQRTQPRRVATLNSFTPAP